MNKPFRITIEHYDEKITIERDYSDLTIEEYIQLLIRISLAAGFQPKTVEEIFND